jgi:hypothetical protein
MTKWNSFTMFHLSTCGKDYDKQGNFGQNETTQCCSQQTPSKYAKWFQKERIYSISPDWPAPTRHKHPMAGD